MIFKRDSISTDIFKSPSVLIQFEIHLNISQRRRNVQHKCQARNRFINRSIRY